MVVRAKREQNSENSNFGFLKLSHTFCTRDFTHIRYRSEVGGGRHINNTTQQQHKHVRMFLVGYMCISKPKNTIFFFGNMSSCSSSYQSTTTKTNCNMGPFYIMCGDLNMR